MEPVRQHQRNWCRTSPLDKLPAKVRAEMNARFDNYGTLRAIRDWLKAEHALSTSLDALSAYWRRQLEIRGESSRLLSADNDIFAGGCQVTITPAPAGAVRVAVRALAALGSKSGGKK